MKTIKNKLPFFKNRLLSIIVLLLLLSSANAVFGQTSGAQINVHITDPQGAVVQNAKVTLYTRDNRIRINGVTDSAGDCRFERLGPGEYLIEAEATDFASAATHVVRLERNSNASLSISLPIAGVSEQVVVTAQATAQPVDEVSKAVSVLDAREIDDR